MIVCVRWKVGVATRCLQKLLLKLGVNPCFDELLRGGESSTEKPRKQLGDAAKMVQKKAQNGTERHRENGVENTVKTRWKRCKTTLRDAAKMGGKGIKRRGKGIKQRGKGIKRRRKGIKKGRKGTKHRRNGTKLPGKAAKMGQKSYELADFKCKGGNVNVFLPKRSGSRSAS